MSEKWYNQAESKEGIKDNGERLYIEFCTKTVAGGFLSLIHISLIDGCGYFKTMTKIMIPMARPSIITVILFQFLAYWNEYIVAFTLLQTDHATLSVGLRNLMQAQRSAAQYGVMYAGLVIAMVPTLILYIIVQKKLTQGMSLGGLKD